MKLVMIGTGYVGLVSGVCLADAGHDVACVDIDASKIEKLRQGISPIYEQGLEEVMARNVAHGRLSFSTDLGEAAKGADAIFICVGTPPGADGSADLSFVEAAAKDIARAINGYAVVVNKSTVPVGVGDWVEDIIRKARPDAAFSVVSNPEFLREGSAVVDFEVPDRIVVGVEDEEAQAIMEAIYLPWTQKGVPLVMTSRRSAEIIKYAANAFLATKITFINEIANLCEVAGGDVDDVAVAIGLDHRIGEKFLKAGPGFGGSCFPKDTQALADIGRRFGAPQRLTETTIAVNDARKMEMVEKIIKVCGGSIGGKTVCLWGLTFKPLTDDTRDSPAIDIAKGLQFRGAKIKAYDPEGMEAATRILPFVEMCEDLYNAAEGSDCAVLVTEWSEFLVADFDRIAQKLKVPVIIDLRNGLSAQALSSAGIKHYSVGRGIASATVQHRAAQ